MSRFPSLPRWSVRWPLRLLVLPLILLVNACSQDAPQDSSQQQAPEQPLAKQQPAITGKTDPLAAYDGSRVGHYSYGSAASEAQIAGWDIDIRPDGKGLPEGSGSVEDGEYLYEDKCAQCHGTFGEGEGRFPVLAGGQDSLKDARPTKTVGSYWPYASTLYDYIYRAMPFTQPESLSPDETYALTAYVLYLNDLVEDDFVLSKENLADIDMPNADNFVPDPRPDVANERCMENCRDALQIKILSEAAPAEVAETEQLTEQKATEQKTDQPGQPTYQQYCSICHAAGVAGAPIVGEPNVWAPRVEQGMATLITHAIEGTTSDAGTMPPKGGFAQLTNEQVGDAVKYMVEASQ